MHHPCKGHHCQQQRSPITGIILVEVVAVSYWKLVHGTASSVSGNEVDK